MPLSRAPSSTSLASLNHTDTEDFDNMAWIEAMPCFCEEEIEAMTDAGAIVSLTSSVPELEAASLGSPRTERDHNAGDMPDLDDLLFPADQQLNHIGLYGMGSADDPVVLSDNEEESQRIDEDDSSSDWGGNVPGDDDDDDDERLFVQYQLGTPPLRPSSERRVRRRLQ